MNLTGKCAECGADIELTWREVPERVICDACKPKTAAGTEPEVHVELDEDGVRITGTVKF